MRFSGFEDSWKTYRLKELLEKKSSSISINQLEDNSGDYPLYGASGFLKGIDFYEMDCDYISIVKDGSGVGNISFHEKNTSVVNTSQYILPKENVDLNFIYYLLQTINLDKYKTGSTIPHIYFKDYSIEKVNIPELNEQKKIGLLFRNIDIKLETLERKYAFYQNFKKYFMQQIFTQKLRFADFTDDWVIKNLGDITNINTGKKDVKDKKDDGKYPFFVRSEKIERIDSYSFDGEAILIPGDGKIGEVYHYINGKFDYHQRVYKISDFNTNVYGKYIYYYLEKNFLRQAMKNTAKATVDSLRLDTLTKMPIELPCLQEQIKIANILSISDNKINMIVNEINIAKNFKKGLLQQMFV